MKSKFLLALCAVISMSAYGAIRSEQEALQVASDFLRVKSSLRRVPGAPSSAWKCAYSGKQQSGEAAFYIFNRGENDGFVMVSAESNTPAVIGYSATGHFDPTDMPDGLRSMMEKYIEEIAQAGESAHENASRAGTYTPVAPLCTTKWGQGVPYNNLCPYYNDTRSVTGCVATAASQIMKYHNYPEHGIGSHSYKWKNANGDSVVISADFEATMYDWANMLDNYAEGAYEEIHANAVATIMLHCGIASEMEYGESGSSANSREMVQAMIEHFGYDKGVRHLQKDYMGTDMLMNAISNDLHHNRPVFISAKTIENSGHAFVCDGIDSDGLLHINWGWKGKNDGYFQLTLFNPKDQGTGGSATNKAYTEKIAIFSNIKPDEGGSYTHSLASENIHPGTMAYHRDSVVVFYIDTLRNLGFTPWEGNIGVRIYQNGATFGSRRNGSVANPLKPGYYRRLVTYGTSFADRNKYPEGEYEIVLGAWDVTDESRYIPIYRKWMGEWRCAMTITADSVRFTPPVVTKPGQEQDIKVPTVAPNGSSVQKYIRDGQLFILRDDMLYTIDGAVIK